MAIAYDNASGSSTGSASSLTYSHTCSGSNRILFVFVCRFNTQTISSVTYGGVTCTFIAESTVAGSEPVAVYYLVAPATGANNVVITLSGASFIFASSSSYTGAKQTGQPDGSATGKATSTSHAISVTTTADNCWGVAAYRAEGDGATSAGAGTTLRYNIAGGTQLYDSNGPKTPAGSLTLTATSLNQTVDRAMVTFSPALPLVNKIFQKSQAVFRASYI